MSTYYDTLGVKQDADSQALRRSYRKLARRFHPDVNPEPGSTRLMARINEAFWTLIDPGRRSEYDAMIRAGLATDGRRTNGQRFRAPVSVRLHMRLRVHKTPVYALSFAPDSGQLVSSSFDNELLWWDPESGESLGKAKVEAGAISALRSLRGERVVAAGSAENLVGACVFDHQSASTWRQTAAEWPSCIAISPDGMRVAAGTIPGDLIVSETMTGNVAFSRQGNSGSVTGVAWSEDGKYLASGSADGSVSLIDPRLGKFLHTFRSVPSTVTAIGFSPGNGFLAVASADLAVRVVGLSDGTVKKVLHGHTRPIECVAFHPNGWLFATGGRDGALGLWNAGVGLGQVYLEASTRPILAAAFSADGKKLASAGLDKTVRIWEISARKL